MVRFVIIRHGFSKGNKEKKFTGQLDLPLDEAGERQAISVSKYVLENFDVDAVYSSDLCRAFDTVKPIADGAGLDVIKTEELREVDVGLWQGKLIVDVEKEFPESFALYKKTPGLSRFDGGESYAEMMERVALALKNIAAENEGKTVVIGTHGGVIRTLRAAWTNTPLERIGEIPQVPNGSVTVVEYDKDAVRLVEVGCVDHLDDKTTEEGVK